MSSYTIPSVVERTERGERVSDIYSRLLSERIVFVGTPIDDGVANVVIAQLLHLNAESERDIQLYLNSSGGLPQAVMAVYDTMRYVAADVATLCIGQVIGSPALLLAGGAPGKRAALPNARVLLHQPATEGARGALSDLALEAAELERIRRVGEEALAEHTGHTAEEIRRDTERALVRSGSEIVTYGLVDRIVDAESGRQQNGPAALRPGR